MNYTKIFAALHKQNKELNPLYKFYHDRHSYYCNEFDLLSEYDKGTKEDYQKLYLELLEDFSNLYFMMDKK